MNHQAPPELTPRAIVLAIVLAMILAGANAYLGLFAGMTIASAIPAAVVSMAVLKLMGGGHILENNIVATGASAGTSIATGVIFTLPALLILGYWEDFRYSWVLAIAGLGGLLGVLFGLSIGPLFRGVRRGITEMSPDLLPPIVHALEPRIAPWSVARSLFISLGVGLIFGVYPARQAAYMDPIEALRHE